MLAATQCRRACSSWTPACTGSQWRIAPTVLKQTPALVRRQARTLVTVSRRSDGVVQGCDLAILVAAILVAIDHDRAFQGRPLRDG